MEERFRIINFTRTNRDSKVKTKMVCIYDSEKVSRETAWKYCKQNSSSRNVYIITKTRYNGVVREMFEALQRRDKDEDSC